ncbi:hypothetical protein, partial [Burkholderia sp. SIMBA_024]|uniref:hypothetical protein n=1 Tax=Burkholderia sp. SIMBA_024 TaxID=3085768 RepID=UPI003977E90E
LQTRRALPFSFPFLGWMWLLVTGFSCLAFLSGHARIEAISGPAGVIALGLLFLAWLIVIPACIETAQLHQRLPVEKNANCGPDDSTRR